MSNCRQIDRTNGFGISRCRGTGARRPLAKFSKIVWLWPSRTNSQPWVTRWRIRSRRFMAWLL